MHIWQTVPRPDPVPQRDHRIEVAPNQHLHVWDTGGDGPALVLLHPATGSAFGWGYQQPVFAKAGFRVIGYARRGYAGSDPAGADIGYPAQDLACILDALNVQSAHLLGAAHGGSFAMDFALMAPERVKNLLLLSSTLSLQDPEWTEIDARLRPASWNALPDEIKELSPSYRAGNPQGTADWMALRKAAYPGWPQSWIWPKLTAPMTFSRIKNYTGPLCLITGDSDTYLSPAQQRLLAGQMPQAQSHVIAEAAHAANWEQPETFNQIALDFFSKP